MLHFGKPNQGRTIIVNVRALGSVEEQTDQEVPCSLKVAAQVDWVVKKVFGIAGIYQSGHFVQELGHYAAVVQDICETALGGLYAVLITLL